MIDASKRHGRVRRDSLDDPYWAERFMFARRVEAPTDDGDVVVRRDERRDDEPPPSGSKRRTTIRVLERIAGAIFKLPRD